MYPSEFDVKRATLSIVVGSQNARSTVSECLQALCRQQGSCDTEVIVVDNSTDGTDAIVTGRFPSVKLIRMPASCLVPELWEAGIRASTGSVVAITTAHCVPDDNWVQEVLKAHHEMAYAGIGGAIENHESGGIVEWAVYFCRYAPYMRPFHPHVIKDIPGDNASYKRWALDHCVEVRHNGFWEPDVHAALRNIGCQLLMSPAIVVWHKPSFTFLGFMRQRFWHGRQFGRSRALRVSGTRRWLYVLASPLIPCIFVARIMKQILTKRRHLKPFVLALPVLMCFLLSWTSGELSGYLWIVKK